MTWRKFEQSLIELIRFYTVETTYSSDLSYPMTEAI
jgi:hypothetical protein